MFTIRYAVEHIEVMHHMFGTRISLTIRSLKPMKLCTSHSSQFKWISTSRLISYVGKGCVLYRPPTLFMFMGCKWYNSHLDQVVIYVYIV